MRIDGLFKSSLFAVLLLGACSPYSLENESILECYPEKRIGTRSVSGQETPQYVFPSINKETASNNSDVGKPCFLIRFASLLN